VDVPSAALPGGNRAAGQDPALRPAAAAAPYAAIHPSSLPGLIGLAALSLALFPLVLWILRFPTAGELQLGWKALHSLAQLGAGGEAGSEVQRVRSRHGLWTSECWKAKRLRAGMQFGDGAVPADREKDAASRLPERRPGGGPCRPAPQRESPHYR